MTAHSTRLKSSKHQNYHSLNEVSNTVLSDEDLDVPIIISAKDIPSVTPDGIDDAYMSDSFLEESVTILPDSYYDIYDDTCEEPPPTFQTPLVKEKKTAPPSNRPLLSSLVCCSIFSSCRSGEQNNLNEKEKMNPPRIMKMDH